MRNLFRRLGARTGISLGLIVIVAVVLIVARLIDDRRGPAPYRAGTDPLPTVSDTEGDDSVDEEEPDAYPDDAVVLARASDFTTAWLRRDLPAEQWLDGLRPLATDSLIERLAGVDPLDVPTNTTLGEPTMRTRSDVYAEVLVPIAPHDALALGLAGVDGVWLVTTLDRETG